MQSVFMLFLFLYCCSLVSCNPLPLIKRVETTSTGYSQNDPEYRKYASTALITLSKAYNTSSGLWTETGWWNSASIITMMADYELVNVLVRGNNRQIFQNTLARAPKNHPQAVKVLSDTISMSTFLNPDIPGGLQLPNPKYSRGFLNGYYDDEGWWALAWLKVYDLTNDVRYINAAITIFDDMTKGYPATCGGIWWDRDHTANLAITNELFFTIAAELANRAANRRYYLQWALTMWQWFEGSGLINYESSINSGINLNTCQNNNGLVWSHNQGVVIGGLLELYQANANDTYITIAQNIAMAAISTLSDEKGILHEKCEPNCGDDATQYKGVFMRNLQYLAQASANETINTFVENNAKSIWSMAQGSDHQLGPIWSAASGRPSVASHSSALDALVAAVAVGKR